MNLFVGLVLTVGDAGEQNEKRDIPVLSIIFVKSSDPVFIVLQRLFKAEFTLHTFGQRNFFRRLNLELGSCNFVIRGAAVSVTMLNPRDKPSYKCVSLWSGHREPDFPVTTPAHLRRASRMSVERRHGAQDGPEYKDQKYYRIAIH